MAICIKKNKGRYIFVNLECLIEQSVSIKIYASFLPIGHTLKDIDETISQSDRFLWANNAVTL